MKKIAYLVSLTALASAPSIAAAAVAPDHLSSRADFEVADGVASPRVARTLTVAAPFLVRQAPTGQLATGTWTTLWDRDTGIASAIYGSGVAYAGSVSDASIAEAAARSLLAEQIDILAPGADASDFVLASNHFHSGDGIRTVGFFQHHGGVRVVGGQIGFRFKNDRMVAVTSQALPNVTIARTRLITSGVARRARKWVDTDFGSRSESSDVGAAVILPIITASGRVEFHKAIPVTVKSASPVGKWTVYIGANQTPVARQQLLKFATGTVNYNVPTRWPGGGFADFPAATATLSVDGANQTTGADGVVTFDNATGSVVTSIVGPFVRVVTETGGVATDTLTINDAGSVSWNENGSETSDAQLATFIHANIAKVHARGLNPDLAWLNQQMRANVNINQSCNAFADGDTINMFRAGQGCGNTGRLADVVYHEFGHNLHINSVIPGVGSFDSAFSEGLSDYLAGTITDSPVMGIGFFNSTEALRHMDQRDFIWPDDASESPHSTGRIFATTMWDIRKMLISKMGQEAGVAHADKLFYAATQRSSDIPGTALEILVADDDDGNLANGTPNQCDLEDILAAHGLAAELAGAAPGLDFPVRERYEVAVPVVNGSGACSSVAIGSIGLAWKIRGEAADREVLPMTLSGENYVAEIPLQDEGQVIQYRVVATYDDGRVRNLPKNLADPYYEFYNGVVTPLYCTDFETDPLLDWTLAGGSNSWEWGAPGGSAGNPAEAFSPTNIFGTQLTGRYAPNANITASTPIIDTAGNPEVRLQYRRWLGVEDSTYDQARISSNGLILWENARSSGGDVSHEDREWRFHDVDLSSQATNGNIEVSFGLSSDQGLQLAGWNLDDVCIVAASGSVCGDEQVTGNETCDNGGANSDSDADACRADCQEATCGDGVVDTGEQCDDGNDDDTDDCSNQCLGDSGGGCGCQSSPFSNGGGTGMMVLFLLLGLGYVSRNRKRLTR